MHFLSRGIDLGAVQPQPLGCSNPACRGRCGTRRSRPAAPMVPPDAWQVCAALAAALLAALIHRALAPARDRTAAPVVPGVPLLGSTLALGLRGAAFIHGCRAAHGDAFTASLAGRQMTFLFHPHALAVFFSAPDADIEFRCGPPKPYRSPHPATAHRLPRLHATACPAERLRRPPNVFGTLSPGEPHSCVCSRVLLQNERSIWRRPRRKLASPSGAAAVQCAPGWYRCGCRDISVRPARPQARGGAFHRARVPAAGGRVLPAPRGTAGRPARPACARRAAAARARAGRARARAPGGALARARAGARHPGAQERGCAGLGSARGSGARVRGARERVCAGRARQCACSGPGRARGCGPEGACALHACSCRRVRAGRAALSRTSTMHTHTGTCMSWHAGTCMRMRLGCLRHWCRRRVRRCHNQSALCSPACMHEPPAARAQLGTGGAGGRPHQGRAGPKPTRHRWSWWVPAPG